MFRSLSASGLVAGILLVAGCPGADGDDPGEGTGSTGEAEPPPVPDFIEPASGRIDVPAHRTNDVVLSVTGVVPGTTSLEIDGVTLGSLAQPNAIGQLTAEALTLRLRGAMIPGVHTLQLANPPGEEPRVSAIVEAQVIAQPPPALAFEPAASTIPGRAVATFGAGASAVLVTFDDTAPDAPILHVVPLGADGWELDQARTVPITGYRRAPSEHALAIAVQRTGPADDPDDDRLRVAWRVDFPGEAIDLIDVRWSDADEDTSGARALSLDPQVLGPFEYAELRRPALLGDTLVAEVFAPTDIEAPRPGDATLITAHLLGRPAIAQPASRLVLGARQDIDAIGPVIDPAHAEVSGPPLLGARLDGRVPVVLTADAVHGRLQLRPSLHDGRSQALSRVVGPLATVVGGLGARSVAGWVPGDSGQVRVLRIHDFSDAGVLEDTLGPDALPDPAAATGDLAVGTLAGFPVWLLPYGPDVPVHAIVGGGEAPMVQALPELHCTQVALAFDPRVPDGPSSIACASGDMVTTGRLRAQIEG